MLHKSQFWSPLQRFLTLWERGSPSHPWPDDAIFEFSQDIFEKTQTAFSSLFKAKMIDLFLLFNILEIFQRLYWIRPFELTASPSINFHKDEDFGPHFLPCNVLCSDCLARGTWQAPATNSNGRLAPVNHPPISQPPLIYSCIINDFLCSTVRIKSLHASDWQRHVNARSLHLWYFLLAHGDLTCRLVYHRWDLDDVM